MRSTQPLVRAALIAVTLIGFTGATAATATAAPQPAAVTVPMKSASVTVQWSLTPTVKVLKGDPTSLKGQKATFVVYAPKTSQITPAMVTKAKALAKQYGGVYKGTSASSTAKAPMVVATYATS